MVVTIPSLPVLPPTAPDVPTSNTILEQPTLADKKGLNVDIKDVAFTDIDPGVFNSELVKLKLYVKPIASDLTKDPKDGGGNIEEGTYAGTQAALTHAYSRIERSYESYFDVLQVEPTLPRLADLSAKQNIYQYSSYPLGDDGKPAQYPPHLQTIPKDDQVSQLKIFNALGLAETKQLLTQVIPTTFLGKTAAWIFHHFNGDISEAADQGLTIKAYEDYNKNNRKSGTDIESGQNIGLLADWFTDRRFAEQSLTGTNPTTLISVAKLKDNLLAEFIETAGREKYDFWAKELPKKDPKSLFVQDCRYFRAAVHAGSNDELSAVDAVSNTSWACAAVTLFELYPNGKLHPIAIVCDYKTDMKSSVTIFNKRHLPTDSSTGEATDWPWRYAKTCAQVSDWLRHEIGVHLTRAHLIEEALIVGTHRAIPMTHIVYKVLEPHWFKTLSLNAAARETLVPQLVKELVGFKEEQLYQFIRSDFESFDYVGSYVPNDLDNRGFPNTADGLKGEKYKNYAYAKNMLSMWSTIRSYVKEMLAIAYDENTPGKRVQDDDVLKKWTNEIRTGGWIKTFPDIKTLDDLCDAITMSIHIAAPFHTAVNYLQSFYQSFVLAKPPALCNPLPQNLQELNAYTERSLIAALPCGRQRQWLLSVQVPWLLSFKVPDERSLLSFAQSQWNTHRRGNAEDLKIAAASETLYKNLQGLIKEYVLTSQAMDKGSIPYTVLDPANTAVSILI
ncbi:lipoxygenase [Ilyonectria destructans]|nr:lipoxygenase [Ilyonectria destructans]